jgi:hypothetical protein
MAAAIVITVVIFLPTISSTLSQDLLEFGSDGILPAALKLLEKATSRRDAGATETRLIKK